jgi:hypothetical protein
MEIIPLIYIENRKIRIGNTSEPMLVKDFLKITIDKKKIYIFDLDGIDRDKPNLCTYQRIASFCDLWADNGPRNLGDIVDTTMAGATDITLRKNLYPQLNISDIREITENKIYEYDEFNSSNLFFDSDGIVTFYSKENLDSDFKLKDILKNRIQNHNTYVYETDLKNQLFWKNLGVKGLLIDFENIKDHKNGK